MTPPTSVLDELDSAAWRRLADQEDDVRADPALIRTLFPAAARAIGRSAGLPAGPGPERLEDAVRCRLLDALADALSDDPATLVAEVRALYRFGDADERRAVLQCLHRLGLGDAVADLVHDGLRTNDPRLVAAALGPYGAEVLDDPAWRQGVLKCLFIGVPLTVVARFEDRADDELVRMVAAYVEERTAAGRDVPDDARRILSHPSTSRET